MHLSLTKRIEVPENWFAGILFPFKLLPVCTAFLLFIWYLSLPVDTTGAGRVDLVFSMAAADYHFAAASVSILDFLSAFVLLVGGFIQFFKFSRYVAFSSIAF